MYFKSRKVILPGNSVFIILSLLFLHCFISPCFAVHNYIDASYSPTSTKTGILSLLSKRKTNCKFLFFPESQILKVKFSRKTRFSKDLAKKITDFNSPFIKYVKEFQSRKKRTLLVKLAPSYLCTFRQAKKRPGFLLQFHPSEEQKEKSVTTEQKEKSETTIEKKDVVVKEVVKTEKKKKTVKIKRSEIKRPVKSISKKNIVREKRPISGRDGPGVQVIKNHVDRGLTHFHIFKTINDSPLQMHVLKVDSNFFRLKIVEPSEIPSMRRATLSKIARAQKAIAGINGMYFSGAGEILGLLKVGDRVISSPVYRRAAIGLTLDDRLEFGYPQFKGELISPLWQRPRIFNAINHKRKNNEIVVYTKDLGKKTPLQIVGREFVVENGRISKIGIGSLKVPENGFILSVGEDHFDKYSSLKVGDTIHYRPILNRTWDNMKFSFSAGPLLLYNGQVIEAGVFENFKPDFINNRHPRSAVGVTRYGSIVFAVVDGRQPGRSVGLSLKEFAKLLKKIGVFHAINLDGGGSSALYLKDGVVNKPSGGHERRIANALLILPKEPGIIALR
ncbi:phosphodiester glycosidase family protein [Candidatus Riflebacteria bacterium]